MGLLSKFEGKMEDTLEGAADRMVKSPISPVQIAKKAEKQMRREKMVGAGKQYAPTLYTVLVNPDDDERLFGYYPTLAGEIETYLAAKAAEDGLVVDGQPLVRFIVDDGLRHGKFEVVAEAVAAPLVAQLRREEMEHYGLIGENGAGYGHGAQEAHPPQGEFGQPSGYAPNYPPAYGEYPYGEGVPDAGAYSDYGNGYDDVADDGYNDYGEGNAVGYEEYEQFCNRADCVTGEPVPYRNVSTPPQPMCLVDTTNNRTYPLEGNHFVIGRESSCDIVFSDINVSRTHAEMSLDPLGAWVLTDLDSTNGTFVNGRGTSSQPLRAGDRITIGMTNLVFDYVFNQAFDQD